MRSPNSIFGPYPRMNSNGHEKKRETLVALNESGRALLAGLLLVFCWHLPAASLSAALQITPTEDARMMSIGGLDGESVYLSVYNRGGNIQRTVIRFDLSGLGVVSEVTHATLRLFADHTLWPTGNPDGHSVEVYRVTQPWREAEVGWQNRVSGIPWAVAGGDYVGVSNLPDLAPYAANNTVLPDNYHELSPVGLTWDVTALAREWVSGAQPNYGLLVLSPPGNGLVFRSRETGSLVPELEVQFAPADTCVPPPSGLVAWWRGENSALDSAGANHGELQNGVSFEAGRVTAAFSFDGVNDDVRLPTTESLNLAGSMTLSLWVKPTTLLLTPGQDYLFSDLARELPDPKDHWAFSRRSRTIVGSFGIKLLLPEDTSNFTESPP